MDFPQILAQRNAEFAENGFLPDLKILPSQRTLILGCVDPRVDPMDVLRLAPGEAAVIRNVGGRVNPALFETLDILQTVSRAAGEEVGPGWHLIVLHHTRCGIIGCLHHAPAMLSRYMGVTDDALEALAIADPYQSVLVDIAALKAHPSVSGDFTVTGLVYDVATGRIETVAPSQRLR